VSDLRVEITDDAKALYIRVDPERKWAKTTVINDFVTVDWDSDDRVIGIEVIGSAAARMLRGMTVALRESAMPEHERALDQAITSLVYTPHGEDR